MIHRELGGLKLFLAVMTDARLELLLPPRTLLEFTSFLSLLFEPLRIRVDRIEEKVFVVVFWKIVAGHRDRIAQICVIPKLDSNAVRVPFKHLRYHFNILVLQKTCGKKDMARKRLHSADAVQTNKCVSNPVLVSKK